MCMQYPFDLFLEVAPQSAGSNVFLYEFTMHLISLTSSAKSEMSHHFVSY